MILFQQKGWEEEKERSKFDSFLHSFQQGIKILSPSLPTPNRGGMDERKEGERRRKVYASSGSTTRLSGFLPSWKVERICSGTGYSSMSSPSGVG